MSLVIGIETNDFIITAAEKICIDKNDIKISDNFNKLIKINSNAIIGCTGSVEHNLYIFTDFITQTKERGFVPSSNYYIREKSFREICNMVDRNFDLLKRKENIKCNIFSMICGFDNHIPKIHILSNNTTTDFQGCIDLTIQSGTKRSTFVGGDVRHNTTLNNLILQYKPNKITEYRNVLKNVFDIGVTFDKKINNNVIFKEIWKS